MGFYYGSSQPPDEDEPGSWKETFAIILVVFKVLALPLGIILGAVLGIFVTIWLFTVHVLLGLAVVLLLIGLVVARGIWEAKHPPDLS